MSRNILGLDIRKEAISAVLISSGIKSTEIISQASAPLAIDNDFPEALASTLEIIFKNIKAEASACAISIPSHMVSYRNLRVPFTEEKKIRQVLPFELEPTLPIPVEGLEFDFQSVKHNGHSELFAAAVEKSFMDTIVKSLEKFKLNIASVMPEGYAAAAASILREIKQKDILVLDNGAGNNSIFAVSSGKIRLARTFQKKPSEQNDSSHLQMNIQRTLTAVDDMLHTEFTPETILAVGQQKNAFIEKSSPLILQDIPIEEADPLDWSDTLKKRPTDPLWDSGILDNALCLALLEAEGVHGINFAVGRSRAVKLWSEFKPNFVATGILLLLVFALAFGGTFLQVRSMEKKLANINYKINDTFKRTFPDVTRIVDPLQQMRIKVQEKGQDAMDPEASIHRMKVVDILYQLNTSITKQLDVDLSRMVVGSDNITFSGNTDTFNTVNDMQKKLEGVEGFNKVTISSANMEKKGNRVKFKIKIQLQQN